MVEVNGVSLHVVEAGSPKGQPVVWLHGIWDRWMLWEEVAKRLPAHHFLVELRGHGESSKPDGAEHYRYADYAADIVALLDALDLSSVALVGFSLGAVTATFVAAQSARVVRVVIVDPPYADHAEPVPMFADLREFKHLGTEELVNFLSFMRSERGDREWRREASWLQATADGPFDAFIAGEQGEQELERVLPQIKKPVLLMQADPTNGGALSNAMATRATQLLPAVRLARFPGSGHNIMHDQRDAFLASVRPFLLPAKDTKEAKE